VVVKRSSIFNISVLTLLAAISFSGGCATPYASESFLGGYDEVRLSENVFRVSFSGNGYTSSKRATNLCMLRCAELALINGFKYFSLIDSSKDVSKSSFTTPSTSVTSGTYHQYGSGGSLNAVTTNYGGQTYHVSKPSSNNTIVCYKIKPSNQLVYEAQFVYDSIGTKYGLLREDDDPTPSSVPNKNPYALDRVDRNQLDEKESARFSPTVRGKNLFKPVDQNARDEKNAKGIHYEAQKFYETGENYYFGVSSLARDRSKAFKYFMKAAKLGHHEASFRVGTCILSGTGTRKNPEEAKKWLQLASERGSFKAKELLEDL
jgi:hypothetical protein